MATIQPDWPKEIKEDIKPTGFWVIEKKEQEAKATSKDQNFGENGNAQLVHFLGKGEAPVYMGWGSMICTSGEYMSCMAVRSLMKTGKRGIILGGWAELDPTQLKGQPDSEAMLKYVSENVLFVKTAPHEWRFPQCSAIVQHGGAGTFAASLRSGRPVVITPGAFDQFEHAKIINDREVGVGLCQFSKVTVQDLAAAIDKCTSDKDIIANSEALGQILREEDGTGTATKYICEWISKEVATGIFKQKLDACVELFKKIRALKKPPSCFAWLIQALCSPTPTMIPKQFRE
jgi:UDP:flavonoid glycosyltransferase YjiC (YdhE family)